MATRSYNNLDAAPSSAHSVATAARLCVHCGTPLDSRSPQPATPEDPAFCCFGCEAVYSILNEKGLARYYELKDQCPSIRKALPARLPTETYAYLDDPGFQDLYVGKGDDRVIEFYLEGVHCVACLWLIEKLPQFSPGVSRAQLDLGRSVAKVALKPGASIGAVARELHQIGYRPHPVRANEEAEALRKRENRDWLVRIGVAGACTGNIMLLAIPLYAGASAANSGLAALFRWTSLVLFLPVLFYSSLPFFRGAWTSLRRFEISIHVPLVLAIVLGTALSTFNLFTGSEHIYFDSLSSLVFLLLASRYVLRRIEQSMLGTSHLLQFLAPTVARRKNPESGALEEVAVTALKAGDLIAVESGETVPADGTAADGDGSVFVSCALLTGESMPVAVKQGQPVYSGSKNEGDRLFIKVTATGTGTRLGAILRQVEEANVKRAPLVEFADRVARWFLAGVLLISLGTFAYCWATYDFYEALNRSLALMIVTCPCALALATPLAFSVSLAKAAREGILVKGANLLEKLERIQTVLLDKTGTLTEGQFQVLSWEPRVPEAERPEICAAVVALERNSKHPVAQALIRYLATADIGHQPATPANFREELGRGVFGVIDGQDWSVQSVEPPRSAAFEGGPTTTVGVHRNGELVAVAVLGDQLRADSPKAVEKLRALGLKVRLLSGDNAAAVSYVGDALGIPASDRIAEATPETKRSVVESTDKALMVGDGANDAIALSSSFVSTAVHGSMEISLKTADTYLTSPGVLHVVRMLEIAKETMRVIRRNLIFSLIYNLAGGAAAVFGLVTPLIAAVLMPISALTVFASSFWGTRKLRKGALA